MVTTEFQHFGLMFPKGFWRRGPELRKDPRRWPVLAPAVI
jgi:hypothetical protein